MNMFLQNLKYGLRTQAGTIGFTLVALTTLALGLGASTAVFSIVNAVMLKPLPYANFARIVFPWRLAPPQLNLGYGQIPWGSTEFQRISGGVHAFERVAAFKSDSFNLTGARDPLLVEGLRASSSFFSTLGVAPTLGRTFTSEEDRPGHEREVVLSYSLWQERLGGDRGILGRAIDLNGDAYNVIGVMPPGFAFPRGEEMPGSFAFPRQAQLWVPLALAAAPAPNAQDDLAIIARLKPDVTVLQAQAEVNVFSKRMEREFPQAKGWFDSRVTSLARQVAGEVRTPVLLILGAVGIVLMIACSNVANLLLARSMGRRAEFAVRTALGAGHWRIVTQLLTESVLLAAGGGILGVLLAEWSVWLVKIFGPANLPRIQEASLDWRVFGFALAVTLLSGILFGIAPAIGASREDPIRSLKEGGRGTANAVTGTKVRNAFLVLEVALALVLIVASGLLVQTFIRLQRVDPGFNAAHVFTFELSLPSSKYKNENQIATLYERVLQRLKSIPGVRAVGLTEMVPMGGAADGSAIRIPGRLTPVGKEPFANYTIASPGYFSAVGTPLLSGRAFLESDTAHSRPVAVVNVAMVKKFWPGENPIGEQVGLASPDFPLMTIIGIVADVKHLSLREEPGPEMYVPFTQKPYPSMLVMQLLLRSEMDPGALIASVHKAVHSVDAGLAVAKVATLKGIVDSSLAGQRFSMLLVGAFGAISLLLASIGVYGTISYTASHRTREIGIRMALGATRLDVFGLVLGQAARLAGLGTIIGLLAAARAARLMASALFGVRPTDPMTFASVTLLVMGVALLASYLPARRAMRCDPVAALRHN